MLRKEAVPDAITASRLVVVAAAYVAAWYEHAVGVVALALLAVATDMVDGILARKWNVASTFGSNLDSAIDFVFYVSFVPWVWVFRPEVILLLVPWILLFLPLYVIVLGIAKLRRGKLGLHNAWTRTTATLGVTIGLYTILWGWQPAFLWVLLVALSADLVQRLAKIIRAPPPQARGADAAER